MKNIQSIIIAGLAMMISVTAYAQTDQFTITGKIGHLNAPAMAYLNYKSAAGWQMDSVKITNGSFAFSGKVPADIPATLFVNKAGNGVRARTTVSIPLYLEAGNTAVTSPDSADNAIVSGGPINTDNARLTIAMAPAKAKIKLLVRDLRSASNQEKQSAAFKEAIEKRRDSIFMEQNSINYRFISQNPNSIVSLFALENYAIAYPDVKSIDSIYNHLSAEVRSSKAGRDYGEQITKMKTTEVGAVAPDFTQTDTAGKNVSLHDFKGKYVLLDFWASWCGPCRAENPNVVNAYNQYKSKGFTVVSVSLDQPGAKDKWLKAIHDDHLTWTQLSDLKSWQNEAAKLYSIQSIPQNFLIGPDGRIVAKNLRGDELLLELEKLFR